MSDYDRVKQHYDNDPEAEWARLDRHRTELAVTLRALEEYLPASPATIADVGGGPGRYAIALTQRGYSVTLADLSQGNLDLAKKKAGQAGVELAGYLHANALDLNVLTDAAFDAVLLMGPLYHLHEPEEREQAVKQVLGKLKPGGRFFAAFITRYAPIRWAAANQPDYIFERPDEFKAMWETGRHIGWGLPNAFFAHPTEVNPLMERCGLKTLDLIGCEGGVSMIEQALNELEEGKLWDTWVDLNYQMGKDPSTHGCAEHLLYVGEKPA